MRQGGKWEGMANRLSLIASVAVCKPEKLDRRLGTVRSLAVRRFVFYRPGIDNYNMALRKISPIKESSSLEFRFETFNTFNHAQFDGANYVDDSVNDHVRANSEVAAGALRKRSETKLLARWKAPGSSSHFRTGRRLLSFATYLLALILFVNYD